MASMKTKIYQNKKKSKRKNRQEKEGRLARHKLTKEVGMILKKSNVHNDYYIVLLGGSFKEWHESNII